jgi:hypothetical protein
MPKTKKLFDWEVFENGELIDIISMTRNTSKVYKEKFPNREIFEIGYTNNE